MGHWVPQHWVSSGLVTAPTITWTDAANGTGGTVAITGSYSGATNTLYAQSFAGEVGTATWTLVGSRTGDGNATVTMSAGHYLLYCLSTSGDETESSTIHYVTATNGTESVEYQCVTGVHARVVAAGLSGISSANIVAREVPTDRNLSLPAIVVAPQRAVHTTNEGSNAGDDVIYGVYIAIFAADNQALTTNTATYTLWLQQLARAFRNQRLPTVAESIICTVAPVATVPWGEWTNNLFAGGLLVSCRCREARGL